MIVIVCLGVTGVLAKFGAESNLLLESDSVRQTNAALPITKALDADQAKSLQEDWSNSLGVPLELRATMPGDIELALVLIPPGSS